MHAHDTLRAIEASGTKVCLVSKRWEPARVQQLYDAGFRRFAESRAGALALRADALPDDIEWHFVGNIQRRDLSTILRHAAMIQSFDRIDLLDRLADSGVEFLLQVDIAGREGRNGIQPAEIPAALDAVEAGGLECSGLMAHPPLVDDEAQRAVWFARMSELRTEHQTRHPSLEELSMGTSDDHALAIEYGATMVRLGRLLTS